MIQWKKIICLNLVLVMLLTMVPVQALAEELPSEIIPEVTEEPIPEATEDPLQEETAPQAETPAPAPQEEAAPEAAQSTEGTYRLFDAVLQTSEEKTAILGQPYGVLPEHSHPNGTFVGWFTEPNGAGSQVTIDSLFEVSGVTLFAFYEMFEVPLLDDDGTVLGTATQKDGYYHGLFTPQKDGYIFDHWSAEVDGSAYYVYENSQIISGAKELRAVWIKQDEVLYVTTADYGSFTIYYTSTYFTYLLEHFSSFLSGQDCLIGFLCDGQLLPLEITVEEFKAQHKPGDSVLLEPVYEKLDANRNYCIYYSMQHNRTPRYYVQDLGPIDPESIYQKMTFQALGSGIFTNVSEEEMVTTGWSTWSSAVNPMILPGETTEMTSGYRKILYEVTGTTDTHFLTLHHTILNQETGELTVNYTDRYQGNDGEQLPIGITTCPEAWYIGLNTALDGSGAWYKDTLTMEPALHGIELYEIHEKRLPGQCLLIGLDRSGMSQGLTAKQKLRQVYTYTLQTDGTVLLPDAVFSLPDGTVQTGWCDETGTVYKLGAAVNSDVLEGKELRADYTSQIPIYEYEGGPELASVFVSGGKVNGLLSTEPVREKYRFAGYYVLVDGTEISVEPYSTLPAGADAIYVRWKENTSDVIVRLHDGNEMEKVCYIYPAEFMLFGKLCQIQNAAGFVTGFQCGDQVYPTTVSAADFCNDHELGSIVDLNVIREAGPEGPYAVYYAAPGRVHYGSDAYEGKPYYVQSLDPGKDTMILADDTLFGFETEQTGYFYGWSRYETTYTEFMPGETIDGSYDPHFFEVVGAEKKQWISFYDREFDSKTGELVLSAPIKYLVEEKMNWKPDIPVNPEGYVFLGWNTDPNGKGTWYDGVLTSEILKEHRTFYAMYEKVLSSNYLVLVGHSDQYDRLLSRAPDGRVRIVLPIVPDQSGRITLPAMTFRLDNGMEQSAWVDQYGQRYEAGEQVILSQLYDHEIYADFSPNIPIYLDEGGQQYGTVRVENGVFREFPKVEPVRENYLFDGYYILENGKRQEIYSGSKAPKGVSAVYAAWRENRNCVVAKIVDGGQTERILNIFDNNSPLLRGVSWLVDKDNFVTGLQCGKTFYPANAVGRDLLADHPIGSVVTLEVVREKLEPGIHIVFYAAPGRVHRGQDAYDGAPYYVMDLEKDGTLIMPGSDLFQFETEGTGKTVGWSDYSYDDITYGCGQKIDYVPDGLFEVVSETDAICFTLHYMERDKDRGLIEYKQETVYLREGDNYYLDDYQIKGYSAMGWNTASDGSGDWYDGRIFVDKTLHGKDLYPIYEDNGGKDMLLLIGYDQNYDERKGKTQDGSIRTAMALQDGTYTVTLPEAMFRLEDGTLQTGWRINSRRFMPGETVSVKELKERRLYADYSRKIPIYQEENGAQIGATLLDGNSIYELPYPEPIRDGFVFDYYYCLDEGRERTLKDGSWVPEGVDAIYVKWRTNHFCWMIRYETASDKDYVFKIRENELNEPAYFLQYAMPVYQDGFLSGIRADGKLYAPTATFKDVIGDKPIGSAILAETVYTPLPKESGYVFYAAPGRVHRGQDDYDGKPYYVLTADKLPVTLPGSELFTSEAAGAEKTVGWNAWQYRPGSEQIDYGCGTECGNAAPACFFEVVSEKEVYQLTLHYQQPDEKTGMLQETHVERKSFLADNLLLLEAEEWKGFVFLGWNTAPDGTGIWYTDTIRTEPGLNGLDLYQIYESVSKEPQLILCGQEAYGGLPGGTTADGSVRKPVPVTLREDGSVVLPALCFFVPDGVQIGWCSSKDPDAIYQPGQTISYGELYQGNLYAVYRRDLILDLGYDGLEYGTASIVNGFYELPDSQDDPERFGYAFNGWYRNEDGRKHFVRSGTKVRPEYETGRLYADWSEQAYSGRSAVFYDGLQTVSWIRADHYFGDIYRETPMWDLIPQKAFEKHGYVLEGVTIAGTDYPLNTIVQSHFREDLTEQVVEVQLRYRKLEENTPYLVYYYMDYDPVNGFPCYSEIQQVDQNAATITLAAGDIFNSGAETNPRITRWICGENSYFPGQTVENVFGDWSVLFGRNNGQENGTPVRFHYDVWEQKTGPAVSKTITKILDQWSKFYISPVGQIGWYDSSNWHYFLGWNTMEDGSGQWVSPSENVGKRNAALELYAMVEPVPKEPHLLLDGTSINDEVVGRTAAGAVAELRTYQDIWMELPGAVFTGSNGERQIGWKDEKGYFYEFGDIVSEKELRSNHIFAVYGREINLLLDYNSQIFAKAQVEDGRYRLPQNKPSRPGYLFSHWYLETNGEKRIVQNGDWESASVDVLHAAWKLNTQSNPILFFENGTEVASWDQELGQRWPTLAYVLRNYLIDNTDRVVTGITCEGKSWDLSACCSELTSGHAIGDVIRVDLQTQKLDTKKLYTIYYSVNGGIHPETGSFWYVQNHRTEDETVILPGDDFFTYEGQQDQVTQGWSTYPGNSIRFKAGDETEAYRLDYKALFDVRGPFLMRQVTYHWKVMTQPEQPRWITSTVDYEDERQLENWSLGSYPNQYPYGQNYVFLGWNTMEDGSGLWYSPRDTMEKNLQVTDLYSILAKRPTGVSVLMSGSSRFDYSETGRTGRTADGKPYVLQTLTPGKDGTVVLPEPIFTDLVQGMQQAWLVDCETYDKIYAPGTKLVLPEGVTVLSAIYGKQVTLDYNVKGTPQTAPGLVSSAEVTALSPQGLLRPGWSFDSWNTKEDGTGKAIWNLYDFEESMAEPVTLYAQWEKDLYSAWIKLYDGPEDQEGRIFTVMETFISGSNLGQFYDETIVKKTDPMAMLSNGRIDSTRFLVGYEDADGVFYHPAQKLKEALIPHETVELWAVYEPFDGNQVCFYGLEGRTREGRHYLTQYTSAEHTVVTPGVGSFRLENQELIGWAKTPAAAAENRVEVSLGEAITVPDGGALYAVYGFRTVTLHRNEPGDEALGDKEPQKEMRYREGETLRMPFTPAESRRIFLGWNTHRDGSGQWYSPYAEATEQMPVALYAQWTLPKEGVAHGILESELPELSFDGPYRKLVYQGDVLPTDVQGEKIFTWFSLDRYSVYSYQEPGETLRKLPNGIIFRFVLDRTEVPELKAILHGNGATTYTQYRSEILPVAPAVVSSSNLEQYLASYGGYFTNTEFDQVFVGWNTRADGTGTQYSCEAETLKVLEQEGAPDRTVHLFAQWVKLGGWSNVYLGNGGTLPDGGTMIQSEVTPDIRYEVLMENPFQHATKQFMGWSFLGNSSDDLMQPGEQIPLGSAFYAVWGDSTTVYHWGEETRTVANQTDSRILDYPIGATPKRGLLAVGWTTQPNGRGTLYAAGEQIPTPAPRDLYLYLRDPAEAGPNQCVLMNQSGGHILVNGQKCGSMVFLDRAPDGTIVLPEIVDSLGFAGWTTNYNYSSQMMYESFDLMNYGSLVAAGQTVSAPVYDGPYSEIVLAPEIARYGTIHYHLNGGSYQSAPETTVLLQAVSSSNLIVPDEDSLVMKPDHDLSGWNTEADGSGIQYPLDYQFPASFRGQMDLYAQWQHRDVRTTGLILSDGAGLAGCKVQLCRGNTVFCEAITNETGHYRFNLAPLGPCNLIIEKDGTINTLAVEITADGKLPESVFHAEAEAVLNLAPQAPEIIVDGLQQEALTQLQNQAGRLKLTIRTLTQTGQTGDIQQLVQSMADMSDHMALYELQMTKKAGVAEQRLHETTGLLTIRIPMTTAGRAGFRVCSIRDGQLHQLQQNQGDEFFTLEADAVVLHVKQLSAYAIGWYEGEVPDLLLSEIHPDSLLMQVGVKAPLGTVFAAAYDSNGQMLTANTVQLRKADLGAQLTMPLDTTGAAQVLVFLTEGSGFNPAGNVLEQTITR